MDEHDRCHCIRSATQDYHIMTKSHFFKNNERRNVHATCFLLNLGSYIHLTNECHGKSRPGARFNTLWLNVAPCYQYDISPVDHITQRLMAQYIVTLRYISARLHTQSHV